MEPYARSGGDIDKARRGQDFIRSLPSDGNRTPLEGAQGFPNERMLWCKRRRAARLHFGIVAAIHAKQKYGVGRMRFGVGFRPQPVRLDGAPECGVCIVHPAETDITRLRER